ncbi:LysR family transcriptional regulator [Pandoraea sp.]|uniref:LysR family transcriptional regulator n=1 Tax=Pandoraea sp. TaxID=1883445 RepID=UPI0011F637A2|nr:LysR family transcriptional regulator [Pandoraea sp.]TAL53056.1 MAG: LysR family transcriptional regulator [Pandoraea sp.]TAM14782.1 MAG: LysR family transcriptional regulator [Pandoraea sp.]
MPATTASLHPTARAPSASHHDDEANLRAYNAVFSELGLRFRWHMETLHWLNSLETDCEKTRIARYLETCQPHLLNAYDADFLSQLIYSKKHEHCRCFMELNAR